MPHDIIYNSTCPTNVGQPFEILYAYVKNMLLALASIASSIVHACDCDKPDLFRHHDRHLQRRDTTPVFPPILTPNEELLVTSFDNTSTASWSSYYSKDHLAPDMQGIDYLQSWKLIDEISLAKAMRCRIGLPKNGLKMDLILGWIAIVCCSSEQLMGVN